MDTDWSSLSLFFLIMMILAHISVVGLMDRALDLKPEANGIEVCTGSKLKPEPGPYPRLSDPTRPDPSGTVKFRARTRPETPPPPPTNSQQKKKRQKAAFHDCMQRNRLIKALPFHKHLPVMKVCEHQVQRSHTFCRVYEFCMDKKIILPPYKLWSFFVS